MEIEKYDGSRKLHIIYNNKIYRLANLNYIYAIRTGSNNFSNNVISDYEFEIKNTIVRLKTTASNIKTFFRFF